MKIWITRSEPGASRLAEAIRGQGWTPVVAPVIGVESLPVSLPPRTAVCVVLSEHAVTAAAAVHAELGFIAIGEQTAAALRAVGCRPVAVPRSQDSEGVIAWLDGRREHLVGHPVLILTGEGGTERVEQYLREEGIQCLRSNVYRRVQLAVGVDTTGVSAIVIASGEAVGPVAEHWRTGQGNADVVVIVPSTRVAALAREAGFARVVVATGASPDAVVRALATL